jgi:hypothetical protein
MVRLLKHSDRIDRRRGALIQHQRRDRQKEDRAASGGARNSQLIEIEIVEKV